MQPYLFPIRRKGTSQPLNDFLEIMAPAASRSIFIIDPCPSPLLIDYLTKNTTCARKKLLTRMHDYSNPKRVLDELMVRKSWEKLSNSGGVIRLLTELSSRIYIADDIALIISGDWETQQSYGIIIEPPESEPVIQMAESLWKNSEPHNVFHDESILLHRLQRLLERGSLPKSHLIGFMNQQGALIDVHVHFFKGWNRITIESNPNGASTQKNLVVWPLIKSDHFRRMAPGASRIHALKNRRYLIDTPAGPFLLNSDRPRWETEFNKRSDELKSYVAGYLETNYQTIRLEAQNELEQLISLEADRLFKTSMLLPVSSEKIYIEERLTSLMAMFPSQQQLADSCSVIYVRLALHPDSIENESIVDIIMHLSQQIELM